MCGDFTLNGALAQHRSKKAVLPANRYLSRPELHQLLRSRQPLVLGSAGRAGLPSALRIEIILSICICLASRLAVTVE